MSEPDLQAILRGDEEPPEVSDEHRERAIVESHVKHRRYIEELAEDAARRRGERREAIPEHPPAAYSVGRLSDWQDDTE